MLAARNKNKSIISRHIKNIFTENELTKHSVATNFATTAADGKKYNINYYNLDIIVTVKSFAKLLTLKSLTVKSR